VSWVSNVSSCGTTATWTCTWSNGGATSAQCSYYNGACPVNGSCNNGTRGWCSAWSLSWKTNTSSCGTTATWNCNGANWWTNATNCSYYNWACAICWSKNGQTLATKPSTNLCGAWTASAVSGAWPRTWSCTSSNTVNCSASKQAGYDMNCLYRFFGNNASWTPTTFFAFSETPSYFDYVSEYNIWRSNNNNQSVGLLVWTTTTIPVTSIEQRCLPWTTLSLSASDYFDQNCTYQVTGSDGLGVVFPKFVSDTYIQYDDWYTTRTIYATSKNKATSTSWTRTITDIGGYCWFSRSSVSLTSTTSFNRNFRYRFRLSGISGTYYVSSANAWNINYSAWGIEKYIPNTSKKQLKNNQTNAVIWTVTSIDQGN